MQLLLLLPMVWALLLAHPQSPVEDDKCNRTDWQRLEGSFSNVNVTNHNRSDALFLTWEKPLGGVQGFLLSLYNPERSTLLQNGSAGPSATSFSFQELLPGTRYTAEVTVLLTCARNSTRRLTGQTIPSPVKNVILSHESPSVLLASWREAPGGKDGYQLDLYHIKSQALVRNVTVSKGLTAFRFEKLLAGNEYALQITTLAGNYKASTRARQWTAPVAPKALNFLSSTSTSSLTASWSDTEGADWLHLTLHNLRTRAEGTTVSLKKGLLNYTFQHLQPGTPYWLEVSAAAGPYRTEVGNITAYTYPLKPINVSLINYGRNNSLKVLWNSPPGERDFYLVSLQEGDNSTPVKNMSAGGNRTQATFHNLSPGRHYTACVTAVAGPHKVPAKSTPAWTFPTASSGGSLSSLGSTHMLHAHWQKAAGTGFVVSLYTMEPPTLVQNKSVPKNYSSLHYEGLSPGTHYALEIYTIAGPYISAPLRLSNWTYPLPPEQLSLSNDGHRTRSLRASWRRSSGSRGHYVGVLLETKSQLRVKNVTVSEDKPRANVSFEGLVPGRQYTLKMVGVAGPYQSLAQIVSGWTYPLVPPGLTLASSRWSSSLVASWNLPSGDRDQFFLRFYSKEHPPLQRNITIGPDAQNFTFEDLLPGTQYFLEVTALAGSYRASSEVVSTWTYPVSPGNVTVKCGQSPQQLHVSWVESGRGRESWVQLYSEESLAVIRNVSVPHGTTQVTLDGLIPGTRYRVEIVSRAGPHHITSQTAIGYTVPLMPLFLLVSRQGTSVLVAQWKAPAGQRDSYMVSVSEEGMPDTRNHVAVEKASTNVTLTGLTPGTCYLVAVWSLAGPYSSVSRNGTACTAPAAPVNVTLKNTGNSSLLYTTWAEPPGGRDHYRMVLYSLVPPGMEKVHVVRSGSQDFLWRDLPAGSQFAVQVIAVKSQAEASSAIAVEWTPPLPAIPVQTQREKYPDKLSIAWTRASGRLDSYELNLYHSASNNRVVQTNLGKDAINFTFSGLTPGAKYVYEIISRAGPCSTSAGKFSAWTRPLPPRMVRLSNKGHIDKLSTSWQPTGGDEDGFVLTLYYAGSGTVVAKKSLEKDATNFTFSGLMPGTKYLLEVASMAGPYRIPAGNVSDWTYPLVPGKLSIKSEKGSPVASVTWSKPLSKPEHCQLQLWYPGNNTMLQHHVLTPWQIRHVFKGLVPGRNYSVSLSCTAGPYKNRSQMTAVAIEPSQVKDLQCLPDITSLFLNWTIPAGDIESYELAVEELRRGSAQAVPVLAVSRADITLAKLTSNTPYQISVRAIGKDGIMGPAVKVQCDTLEEVLPPPVRMDALQFDDSSRIVIFPDMFSEENGLIEYYGVVVTTNDSLLRPTQDIISHTWYDHYYGQEESYLALLVPNPFHLNESTGLKAWTVTVGTEECNHSRNTCNGKLKTDTQYRFSIAAFTRYSQQAPRVSFTTFSAVGASAASATVSTPVVAGIIMGFLLTVTAIAGLIFWRHQKARRMEKGNVPQEMATYSLRNTHRPILLQNFRQYYEARAANSNQGFFQDFEELKEVGKEQSKAEGEVSANSSKNRYPHVLPYDYSRVKLSLLDGDPHSDYINANFVPGYSSPQEFIATQGPMKKTLDDFWRLVWEQHVCTIVMLTVGMENGRAEKNVSLNREGCMIHTNLSGVVALDGSFTLSNASMIFIHKIWIAIDFLWPGLILPLGKVRQLLQVVDDGEQQWQLHANLSCTFIEVLCECYWPSDSSPVCSGQVSIHLLAQNFAEEWATREFKLHHEGLNMERRVVHLHYTAWPNHGVPESTTSMIAFIDLVRVHMQNSSETGPTLVHGSAGVGRTGTFIALDRLLQQLKHEKVVDVFNTVYSLRRNRHRMIETLGQYIFLHNCILEKLSEESLLDLSGVEDAHPIPLKNFLQHHAKNCSNANSGFLREYEMLLEAAKEEVSSAILPSDNQQISLHSNKSPYNRSKVKFSPLDREPFSDLPHVWFIPGCNSIKDYIAIEGPYKLAVEEFWGLIWEHGVHTIITLQNSPAPDNSCWPSESEPVCTDRVTVQKGPEKVVSGWQYAQLRLKYEKKAKERLLQRFRFPLGEREDLPDPEILLGFLTTVRELVSYRKRTSPLVLHCSLGSVSQMGMLIALDSLLQQLKEEKSVDVYGVVLRLVKSCCLMTPTLDKYIYLHECICELITQKQV